MCTDSTEESHEFGFLFGREAVATVSNEWNAEVADGWVSKADATHFLVEDLYVESGGGFVFKDSVEELRSLEERWFETDIVVVVSDFRKTAFKNRSF